MDNKPTELALSFISEQPLAACKIIEEQTLEQTLLFVEGIPLKFQVLLFQHFLPTYAARVMEMLDSGSVGSIANALEVSVLTRLLRVMDDDKAAATLETLRLIKRNACELLMNYPHFAVGAWMQTDVAIVTTDMSMEEAKSYLLNTYQGEDFDHIVVSDREGKLEGRLPSLELLKAKPSQLVHEVMIVDPPWMSPNFLLESAAQSYLWESNDLLVIVDKEKQILGLLKHADLRMGLAFHESRTEILALPDDDMASSLVNTYGSSLLVLFNTVLDVVEPDLRS